MPCEMPVPLIPDFFEDLDRAWKPTGTGRTRLPIIGAGALLLQTSYVRLTKDSDVLETPEIDEDVRRQLEDLAGKQSRLSQRHKVYVDVVRPGLPLLPQRPNWVPTTDWRTSRSFRGSASESRIPARSSYRRAIHPAPGALLS
jgi:hypothetical protein